MFTVAHDGTLNVAEHAEIETPENKPATIERTYWGDWEQQVRFLRVTRADGAVMPIETPREKNNTIRWTGESGTYVIESTIGYPIIPAWGLPRALELSRDESHMIRDPRDRVREILPIWRDAARKPHNRVLLDFQYEMPPPSQEGTDIQLQLYWPNGWTPVHSIFPDTIAKHFPFDTYNSTRWRVQHTFDIEGPEDAVYDLRPNLIRMGAIFGFPIACLVLWLFFLVREILRRGLKPADAVDETVLHETVFNEPPEVVATRWTGLPRRPRIETFLRRLEKQHKLGLRIERNDTGDARIDMRLLVPRDRLSPYERAGIDVLIPEGFEATSDDVRKRYDELEEGFDPTDALYSWLSNFAREINGPAKSPWWSRLTSFLLFVYGFYMLVWDLARHPGAPYMLAAALIISSMLTSLWPDNLTRMLVRNSLWAAAIPLLPIAIATLLVLGIHLAIQIPPGLEASVGFSAVLLSVGKAALAASGTRDPRTSLQRRAELVRARRWFAAELRNEHPRIREEQWPWVSALGLAPRTALVADEEDWGEAFAA